MKYTLIIPHYNDTERLNRLLKTIPVDRKDVEVLVIDDCSTKKEALNTLQKDWPKVHWLSTPKNLGAGAARNIGLEVAVGKYLVFADSDDEFLPSAFDVFDENITKDDMLVYFLADAKQELTGERSNRADSFNKLCLDHLKVGTSKSLEKLKVFHVIPVTKIYSKEVVDRLGIRFEESKVSNDVMFNVLAAVQIERIKIIPKTVYRIYRRESSLTADSTSEAFLERMQVAARLATELKKRKISSRPSAAPYILQSFSYDFGTVLKAIYLAIFSDMKLNLLSAINPWRWFVFLQKQFANKKEKASVGK